MNIPVARQLLLLAAVLTFLALLIGRSAFVSWREIRELRGGFTTVQLESFRIADQLQAGLLKLDSRLLKYADGRRPEDWRSFEDESRRLDAWIDQQKAVLTTPEEKAVLSEINAAYDGYLAAANEIAAGAAPFDKFKVEAADERLISLGLKLANAHREALGRFVASTQQSLALLQAVIFTALLALVLLVAWAAAVVYHEMIAPLRSLRREAPRLNARRRADSPFLMCC